MRLVLLNCLYLCNHISASSQFFILWLYIIRNYTMNATRYITFNLLSTARSQTKLARIIQRPQALHVRSKATMRIFRQRLPKYKKNLGSLSDLTELLIEQEEPNDLEDALKLRENKLDVYKEYLPVDHNTTLIEALFNRDNDIDRLLKVVDENLETMTSFYIGVSFEVIDDMLRAKLCDKSTVAVSPEFKRLCIKTIYKIRFFDSDDVLKLVKCLSSMGVPENTLLVQAALNMARHLINDFSPQELRFITKSYDLLKPTKFIETKTQTLVQLEST